MLEVKYLLILSLFFIFPMLSHPQATYSGCPWGGACPWLPQRAGGEGACRCTWKDQREGTKRLVSLQMLNLMIIKDVSLCIFLTKSLIFILSLYTWKPVLKILYWPHFCRAHHIIIIFIVIFKEAQTGSDPSSQPWCGRPSHWCKCLHCKSSWTHGD